MSKRKFKVQKVGKKKKSNLKKNMFSAFIIIIMVSSVIGFMSNRNEDSQTYDKYNFQKVGDNWILKIDNNNFNFYYLPSNVDGLEVNKSIIDKLKNTYMLYFTFDPNAESVAATDIVRFEIANDFPKMTNLLGLISGVTYKDNRTAYAALPVITCANATDTVPVINVVFDKKSNSTSAIIKDNCITITATRPLDVIAIYDRIVYGILGIIKN